MQNKLETDEIRLKIDINWFESVLILLKIKTI